ncbi:MAG: PfkB family carbohydrate kinase [Acidobacteriota bacterium]
MKKADKKIGLTGSITHDLITLPSGSKIESLGGVLYPASVLCGLERQVCLIINLAEELAPSVLSLKKEWLNREFNEVKMVPGPGNRVNLYYPRKGERQEILESVVPPLEPKWIISRLPDIDFLILLMISGLDIKLRDWNKIKEKAECPIWMDIHSLVLSPELGRLRKYISLPNWRDWVRGIDYLQANKQEAACMMGSPEKNPNEKELYSLGESALEEGIKAVFITLGEEGILVVTPQESRKLKSTESNKVADTTGCGDVFCGAVVSRLMEGEEVLKAGEFGLKLASEAVKTRGVQETFKMVQEFSFLNSKRGFHEK